MLQQPSTGRLNHADYAIVIGLSRYANFDSEPGAEDDARAFADWLVDERGGALPPENVRLLTSSGEGSTSAALGEAIRAVEREAGGRRSRIYLYVSGLSATTEGYGPLLLQGDVSERADEGIDVEGLARHFSSIGFTEVVLVVDCTSVSHGATKPLAVIEPGGAGGARSDAAVFIAVSGGTYPGDYPSGAKQRRGALTAMLLEALRAAAERPVDARELASWVDKLSAAYGPGYLRPKFEVRGPAIVFGAVREVAEPRAAKRARKKAAPRDPSDAPPGSASEPRAEAVASHADDPAKVDMLLRRPFARVIADRIEEVSKAQRKKAQAEQSAGSFTVHLHGPWGAGKSSVLNFLREHLRDDRPAHERWVVVEFNAWRQQRIRPPWWTLIKAIYSQSAAQLPLLKSLPLRLRWMFWRARADWLPLLIVAGFIAATAILLKLSFVSGSPVTAAGAGGDQAKAIDLVLKTFAVFTAIGAVYTLARTLVFGSARAAQTYTDLRSDPMGPVVRIFEKLVAAVPKPIVVFIDDLDRCDSVYVVELLEGIQTLFRTAPITYVVAADRKWICSSFEKTYETFGRTLGEPGRPLGYLFLDKIFQLSTSVPRLASELQRTYWRTLLAGTADAGDAKTVESLRERKAEEARQAVSGTHTQEGLEAKIAEARSPEDELAMRAAAAQQITSAVAQRTTEHRLQRFAMMLEANPRAMKRLVNAYGMHQAANLLEGRKVSSEALAQWTILELRWPLLADLIALRPHLVDELADGEASHEVPEDLRPLFGDARVRAVVGGAAADLPPLDSAAVSAIVGTEQQQRKAAPRARAAAAAKRPARRSAASRSD